MLSSNVIRRSPRPTGKNVGDAAVITVDMGGSLQPQLSWEGAVAPLSRREDGSGSSGGLSPVQRPGAAGGLRAPPQAPQCLLHSPAVGRRGPWTELGDSSVPMWSQLTGRLLPGAFCELT